MHCTIKAVVVAASLLTGVFGSTAWGGTTRADQEKSGGFWLPGLKNQSAQDANFGQVKDNEPNLEKEKLCKTASNGEINCVIRNIVVKAVTSSTTFASSGANNRVEISGHWTDSKIGASRSIHFSLSCSAYHNDCAVALIPMTNCAQLAALAKGTEKTFRIQVLLRADGDNTDEIVGNIENDGMALIAMTNSSVNSFQCSVAEQ